MWEWNHVDQVFCHLQGEHDQCWKSWEMIWRWDTVSATRSSHHFVPLSSSRIGHKLTSEDEPYVDIDDFNVPTFFEIGDISASPFFTCIYNSFWWVVMISLVGIAAGNVINIDFMHPHGLRKTFKTRGDSCYIPVKSIIQKISTPTTSTGRTNKINDEDTKNCSCICEISAMISFYTCYFTTSFYKTIYFSKWMSY